MNKLTLQINNLEALERLIGGDSQIEIDIRNSVVQKFAEKHLKPLANSPLIEDTVHKLNKEITAQISDQCAKSIASFKKYSDGSLYDVKLHPEIKTNINREIESKIYEKVSELVTIAISESNLDSIVQRTVERVTENHVKQLLRNKLDKLGV
jgi:queuine/archaeosine tRNA-ribosyltransferase